MKPGLLLLIILLSGCGISENIKPGSTLSLDSNSAILMLGISPDYRIHFLRGILENDVWNRPTPDIPEVNIFPSNGYIIVKVEQMTSNYVLGIGTVFLDYSGYAPCSGDLVPVFDLKPGAVNYVGHLSYKFGIERLSFTSSIKNDEARAYLEDKYPDFVHSLVFNPMKIVKANSNFCKRL